MNFTTSTTDEKREYLTALLHEGEVKVTFTKVNGEVRVMPCSLKESLLPVLHETNTENPIDILTPKKERKENPEIIRVFCTDKQAWRSFRIDSVLGVEA